MVEILRTVEEARAFAARHHAAGRRVALVPTMGYLHDGHLGLIRLARQHADAVVTSIFVNPTQFGPNEDFERYPRDPEGDLAKAASAGTDAVFMPEVGTMYPPGHRTKVTVSAITEVLCGASRPTHFAGVTTVVLKLFLITRCDVAVFGEKDFQQLAVIRRMVADLDVPVRVVGHPIVREPDGLALSSRNVYLSPEQRAAALSLSRGLASARRAWDAGERDPRALERVVREVVDAAPGADVDYIEARDAADLSALEGPATRPVVVALAVRFGRTRLIDNAVLA
jgi:pantoate--beta-alanine ligase